MAEGFCRKKYDIPGSTFTSVELQLAFFPVCNGRGNPKRCAEGHRCPRSDHSTCEQSLGGKFSDYSITKHIRSVQRVRNGCFYACVPHSLLFNGQYIQLQRVHFGVELLVLVFELSLIDLYKKFCPSVTSEIMLKVMDGCVVFRFRESWICEQNWSIINVGGCSEVNIGLQRSYPTSGSHVPKMSCCLSSAMGTTHVAQEVCLPTFCSP